RRPEPTWKANSNRAGSPRRGYLGATAIADTIALSTDEENDRFRTPSLTVTLNVLSTAVNWPAMANRSTFASLVSPSALTLKTRRPVPDHHGSMNLSVTS